MIRQSVILALPAFEPDMPPDVRQDLARLALLNDVQLWKAANSVMDESRQIRLEQLAELQKQHALSEILFKLDS